MLSSSHTWKEIAVISGVMILVTGAVALIAATLIEDVLTAGVGVVDGPASFAIASGMMVTARVLYKRHAISLWNRFSGNFGPDQALWQHRPWPKPKASVFLMMTR